MWKGERAERIEVALFDAAPKLRPPQTGFQWEEADPLTTFDVKRFNAIRGYQAQQGREISRCLKELRLLRKEALADARTNPRRMPENEPESPPAPANDDARKHRAAAELIPGARARKRTRARPLGRVAGAGPRRAGPAAGGGRLAGAGSARGYAAPCGPLGWSPADLASPAALGRALERLMAAPAARADHGDLRCRSA